MPLSLLLIDDRKDMLDFFRKLLTSEGYDVHTILHEGQSEPELAKQAASTKASLLLIDGNLAAEVKGYNLLPVLRAAIPGVRIFGFSTAESMKQPFLDAGAEGFVLKDPYNPAQTVLELEQEILAKGT